MRVTALVAVILAIVFFSGTARTQTATKGTATTSKALIDKYCISCHSEKLKTGGLSLEGADLAKVADHGEMWEKVVRKVHGGMMPPAGMPRPDANSINGLTNYLVDVLDRAAVAKPNPGRASIHRLNRNEYANAIRDLLDLDVDVKEYLPADDESDGFDNIADVLKVSPSLLEQYLAASRKISALAVGDPAISAVSSLFRVPPDTSQDDQIEGLPLGTRGGILIRHNFPLDGEYDINVALLQNIVGYLTGLEWGHKLEIAIDGERVFLTQVGGPEDNKLSDTNLGIAKDTIDARLKTRVTVKAGPHDVSVAFLRKNSAESVEPLEPHTHDHDLQNMNGIPLIEHVQITGPFKATGPGDTPSRRRIFSCRPSAAADEVACARKILASLGRRAYRRPLSDADVETLLGFYQQGRNSHEGKPGNFEAGIENALRLILANPKFLFRAESDPANAAAGSMYRVSDLDLASRLSFFLWSSAPDETLLNLAASGKLHENATLEQQVKRMLADPKARTLSSNFAAQWLYLRNVQSTIPDPNEFPNFDDNLRQAFRTETEMLFDSIVREDRSVMDLINADYTFVNERLAKHYGIPGVYGSQFRRVPVADERRRGLFGQGSILIVTSEANRTSPVKRGKWILENVLGTPPPAPPPNVPGLKENGEGGKFSSVRERLEEHRKNPVCAACHRMMDPIGFSLENFDAIGQWRTKEPGGIVDSTGQLVDGTKVDGPVALRKAITARGDQFIGTMTEKMLTYALGRGLEYYDMPVVRSIVRNAAKNNNRFSSLVMGVVTSTPFEMRMKSVAN